jgi:ankyrin repeat protein
MPYLGEDDPFNLVSEAIDKKTRKPLIKLRKLIVTGVVNVNAYVDEITLIGQVAEAGDLELVSLMISLGSDVNFRDTHQVSTPLMDAVNGRNLEIVMLLIKSGADPNIMREGNYALMIAAENGDEKLFEFLFPLTYDNWRNEARNILEKEIKNKKRILDAPTKNLFKAIENKNLEKVCEAIAKGADVNASDKSGLTVLYRAVTWCPPEIIKTLLDAEVKINWEILSILVNPFASDILKIMIEYRANLDIQSPDGITLLMTACMMKKYVEIVKILVTSGAKVDLKDKKGNTAFTYAYASKNYDAIKLL